MESKKTWYILGFITIITILFNIYFSTIKINEVQSQIDFVSKTIEQAEDILNSKEYVDNVTKLKENEQVNKELITTTDLQLMYQDGMFDIDTTNFVNSLVQKHSNSSICNTQIKAKVDAYKAQIRKQNILAERSRRGNMGRFYVPAVGLDVAVFNSISQAVCDAADSACYFSCGGSTCIGDHNYQGFYRIKQLRVGQRGIFFEYGDRTAEYQVVDYRIGYNTKSDLVDRNYNSMTSAYPNDILLYTCNDWAGRNITIVVIRQIA